MACSAEDKKSAFTIGVLAVQGAFAEHLTALQSAIKQLNCPFTLKFWDVRSLCDITSDMIGLIIPGGESTTISSFLRWNKMVEPLREWIGQKNHVTWGTCAGMIILSKSVENQNNGTQPTLAITDTVVSRNYFGRQIHSFEVAVSIRHPDIKISESSENEYFKAVFIRAPAVTAVNASTVEVLVAMRTSSEEKPVVVAFRQGQILSTAFHPELTDDLRWHRYFLNMVISAQCSEK